MNNEFIVCAAIWYDDGVKHPIQEVYNIPSGFVICGFGHACMISIIPTNNSLRKKEGIAYHDRDFEVHQGFMTSSGRFVEREEALQIAIKAHQVIKGKTYGKDILYSEDLYDWYNGKIKMN